MRESFVLSIIAAAYVAGCSSSSSGPAGAQGSQGAQGAQGPQGNQGPPGPGSSAEGGAPVLATVDSLQLPPSPPYPGFYPATLSAASDGSLFVGGVFGEIVKYSPDSVDPLVVVPPLPPPKGPLVTVGILVDEAGGMLYACANSFTDFAQLSGATPFVYAYSLSALNGSAVTPTVYSMPAPSGAGAQPGICADLALDPAGNLYITDEVNGLLFTMKSPITPSSTITEWAHDPLLAANFVPWPPAGAGPYTPPFGAHGLTVNGSNVFVTNYYNGTLVKVPVKADGSAGQAVVETVTPTLGACQGIRTLDATHMVTVSSDWAQPVLAEDGGLVDLPAANGSLILLTLGSNGDAGADTWNLTTLADGIQGAASVAVADGSFWVAESQATPLIDSALFATEPGPDGGVVPSWGSQVVVNPNLPFRVYRVNETP
jgi:hypothetical protein